MNYKIEINNINIVEQLEGYWTDQDYIELLKKFDYPDATMADKENFAELLSMAINDNDPKEAAAILLGYKLADSLNEGQIQQISNEMLSDKVCEEYPEIGLHQDLFQVNQLLYRAYNGKFPNAKAIVVSCSISPADGDAEKALTRENILKLFSKGLSGSNIIKRLFDEGMNGSASFAEAEDIIWNLDTKDNINYVFNTSENWIGKEDIVLSEFEGVLEEIKDEA